MEFQTRSASGEIIIHSSFQEAYKAWEKFKDKRQSRDFILKISFTESNGKNHRWVSIKKVGNDNNLLGKCKAYDDCIDSKANFWYDQDLVPPFTIKEVLTDEEFRTRYIKLIS